jgi:hypothetical protein
VQGQEKKMTSITAPSGSAPLNLDTSTYIFATNPDGTIILDEDTNKPIHIAQDLTTGIWYRKGRDGFSYREKDKSVLKGEIDAGAVHVPHRFERFRGLWFPLKAASSTTGVAAPPAAKFDTKTGWPLDPKTGKPIPPASQQQTVAEVQS